MARVGLLGGTFNPPHVGHMLCAQEALAALELERVLLMPVHAPPHKQMEADPGPEVRLELCRLAAGDAPGIEVSAIEVERPGRSYTVDTLRALHDARPEDDLTFIAGADQASGLPGWREPAAVLELAELAVAEREATRRDDVLEALRGLPGAQRARALLLDAADRRLLLADPPAGVRGPPDPLAGARRGRARDRRTRPLPAEGGRPMTHAESRELADRIAELAADKLAVDVVVIDLHDVIGYTDFFVICSGNTERQTKAIHDGVHQGMKQEGVMPRRVEGLNEARWILMDYLDVIVHVFTPDARDYYRLEQLWGEAPRHAVGA